MDWNSIALTAAGVIGGGTAVIHGVVMQRIIIRPIEADFAANGRISGTLQKLIALLLHVSTFNWLLSGIALIAAAIWFEHDVRLVVGLLACSSFLYGAIIAFWSIRRAHPGGILMSAACILIVLGLTAG
ncbi:hypothetical protein [Paenibacillus ihbetae]|uniref:DUF1304 domain-containing protein n=1 Tax=Paenibacillus ihbetae TaxID=1870820 RepID=A0A1B2DTY8_9BACL|nr:hypothetical protein [Paenibacillus ihbetae]ANY71174.1 hypothetical protein BBD41_00425 [Paenibacillus ihbetae]OOC61455.1 hypothetical protein BBD40_05900 [Paenibacillus ihbetae]